jgi:sortase A
MQPGMALSLETAAGQQLQYRVLEVSVFDSHIETLPAARHVLILVTCYPFAAASAGGPLRWVVHAVKFQSVNHPAILTATL